MAFFSSSFLLMVACVGWVLMVLSLTATLSKSVFSISRSSGSGSHLSDSDRSDCGSFVFLLQLEDGGRQPPHGWWCVGASAYEECRTQTINNAATSALGFGARVLCRIT